MAASDRNSGTLRRYHSLATQGFELWQAEVGPSGQMERALKQIEYMGYMGVFYPEPYSIYLRGGRLLKRAFSARRLVEVELVAVQGVDVGVAEDAALGLASPDLLDGP